MRERGREEERERRGEREREREKRWGDSLWKETLISEIALGSNYTHRHLHTHAHTHACTHAECCQMLQPLSFPDNIKGGLNSSLNNEETEA
jgi:hypothetical protein